VRDRDLSRLEAVLGIYIPIIYKRFKVENQADFGTNGSQNSFGISNRYRYQLSKLIDLQIGWNIMQTYHHNLIDDIKLFGLTAGIGFRF
jgi:hypothetical protein